MSEDTIEPEIISIPLTRSVERSLAERALGRVQELMDEASRINRDLGVTLAGDHGVQLKTGDKVRFAQDDEGNISLLILQV